MTLRLEVQAWIRIVWLCAAFVVFGVGIGLIWWPSSEKISQLHARSRELYEEANSLDESTRRVSQLRSAQERVQSDLRTLGGPRSDGAVTAALLRLFHDEAKEAGVEVREISPDSATPAKSVSSALSGYDLTVRICGPFRNIIRLVADLPRHDVLVDVHDVQIASTGAELKPQLDVTLHTTIYRVVFAPSMESQRVRALR